MSDTPRTDALVIETWGSLKPFAGHPVAEFARQLERELSKREKQLIETQHMLITRNNELFTAWSRIRELEANLEDRRRHAYMGGCSGGGVGNR